MAEIEFGTFEAEEKVNPYTATVEKLAALNDENAAVTLTVDVNDRAKEQFKFQRAANAVGKTARIRKVDESAVKQSGKDEDDAPIFAGPVKVTFTLTKMHKARRGKKTDVAASDEASE